MKFEQLICLISGISSRFVIIKEKDPLKPGAQETTILTTEGAGYIGARDAFHLLFNHSLVTETVYESFRQNLEQRLNQKLHLPPYGSDNPIQIMAMKTATIPLCLFCTTLVAAIDQHWVADNLSGGPTSSVDQDRKEPVLVT